MIPVRVREERFASALHELAGSGGAELLPAVFAVTSATTQRRAWTSLAWWLPSRAPMTPRVATRRLVVVLVVTALVAVAVGYVGSRPPPLPIPAPRVYRGVFEPAGPLPVPEADVAAELPDGRVLLVANGSEPVAMIWDPPTRGSIPAVGNPPNLVTPSAISLRDGRALILGNEEVRDPDSGEGHVGASVAHVFDPMTRTFTSLGPTASPRWGFGVVELADGRLLVVGGIEPPGDRIEALATAEVFDPATGTFTPTGNLVRGRIGPTSVAIDGGALVVGGRLSGAEQPEPASAEFYDAATGRFTELTTLPEIPPDTLGYRWPLMSRGPLITLPDGRAMIAGLSCQEVSDTVDLYSAGYHPTPTAVFDPATRVFTPGATIPHCVEFAFPLADGRVLVTGWWYVGGSAFQMGTVHRWAGLFDPTTGQTSEVEPPPSTLYMTMLPLSDGRVLVAEGGEIQLFE
jgi:hypothetical protein